MKGWYGDKQKHSLASRGIKSKNPRTRYVGVLDHVEYVDEDGFYFSNDFKPKINTPYFVVSYGDYNDGFDTKNEVFNKLNRIAIPEEGWGAYAYDEIGVVFVINEVHHGMTIRDFVKNFIGKSMWEEFIKRTKDGFEDEAKRLGYDRSEIDEWYEQWSD